MNFYVYLFNKGYAIRLRDLALFSAVVTTTNYNTKKPGLVYDAVDGITISDCRWFDVNKLQKQHKN